LAKELHAPAKRNFPRKRSVLYRYGFWYEIVQDSLFSAAWSLYRCC